MEYLLLLAALFGHTALWVAVVNRVHGLDLPYHVAHRISQVLMLLAPPIALAFGLWFLLTDATVLNASSRLNTDLPGPVTAYLIVCWINAGMTAIVWLVRRFGDRSPEIEQGCHRQRVVLCRAPAAKRDGRGFLLRLPGNETLQLDLTERVLEIASLPPALAGLSIVHVSDLHFTGRVNKDYFEEVVHRCNQFQPDLVAVTGDLLDFTQYVDWVPATLGRLESRYGAYFVLGNHDTKIDFIRLRKTLTESGLVDLGSRWVEIFVDSHSIVLAGNELPWFSPAADLENVPPRTSSGPLRIALAHSPDQLPWAQRNEIDLLLAGHTHGGQIRLPGIGPILTPSLAGVKYACGVFYRAPTVMHVSRGVSGEHPIRWNCPPEITRLVLRPPEC